MKESCNELSINDEKKACSIKRDDIQLLFLAGMVKLVDTPGLGPGGDSLAGSNPAACRMHTTAHQKQYKH